MKATKKIIIGVIAVIALLITIAGAMAVPTVTYSPPTSPSPVVLNNETKLFTVSVTDPTPDTTLSYQWKVDNAVVGNTSTYPFVGSTHSVGPHQVSVIVTEDNILLSDNVWAVTVQEATPATLLSITNVKVNGKSNGKLSLSDLNEVKVEISNDHTKKIENIVVTVRILDVDGDDLEEESDEFDLSSGKEHEETLEFDLSDETVDEDEYTIEVEVEGEDTDGADFSELETLTVEVDREKDDLIITKTELEDNQVICSASTKDSLKVSIKNVGENDQDGAKITVKNADLGLNLQRENIDLDDYSGSDNGYDATFAINLEDAVSGTYALDVAVYSEDNDLMDSEEVELQVQCADAAKTPSKEGSDTEQYADKELAAELQHKLDEYKAMQESQAASKNNTFRESNSYMLLLGVLVAMMFFAAVLTATYLLVKRK